MSTESKLKPCPFCGSEDVLSMTGYEHGTLAHYVRCQNCAADGPWLDDECGTKWNSAVRKHEVRGLLRLVDAANQSRHEIGRHQAAEKKLYAYAKELKVGTCNV